jgi:putative hydrolase of the HAD superfamily
MIGEKTFAKGETQMTLRAILFDLDDTLLWDARSVQEALLATCEQARQKYPQIDPEKMVGEIRRHAFELYATYPTYEFTCMIGTNPLEGLWADFSEGENFAALCAIAPTYRRDVWRRALAAFGVEDAAFAADLAETFRHERRSRPLVYEETYEVLDQLKGRYQMLLLTNGSPDLQKLKLSGVPEMATYFDHIVISGEFGRGKPDPSIFEHALGLLNIRPEEAIMVGDKLTTDILGATRAGITSVWINREHLAPNPEIKPTYEIHNLRELLDLVQKI